MKKNRPNVDSVALIGQTFIDCLDCCIYTCINVGLRVRDGLCTFFPLTV